MATVVLSIGQCGFDDSRLARFLRDELNAVMDRAHSARQAQQMLAEKKYGLVLVNRVFDGDGESGVEFIAEARQLPDVPPLMLISDYPEAQQAALANGAVPGFGKSALSSPDAAVFLKRTLKTPAAKT